MATQDTWDTPVTSMWKYGMFFRALKHHPDKPTGTWGKAPKMSRKEIVCYWSPAIIYLGACLLGVLDVLFVAVVFGLIAYQSFGDRLIEQKTIRTAVFSGVVSLLAITFILVSPWTGYESKAGYTLGHLFKKEHHDLDQTIYRTVHNGVIRLQRS